MALSRVMKLTTDKGLNIELAPFPREEAVLFVKGFEQHSISQYVADHVETKETEEEWYDAMIKDKSSCVWGIWAVESEKRKLIGSSSLTHISTNKHIHQAVSGSIIFDKNYWGQGIASACHKARTLWAFEQMGLHRIKSAVLQPNIGSRKALERSGYTYVYTERNEKFVNGELIHLDCFECLNPADWAWRQWWGNDRPPRRNIEARAKTQAALIWARENVELA